MPTKFEIDAGFVRTMAKLLRETGLTEIEYAEGDKRIRLSSAGSAVQTVAVAAPATAPVAAAPTEAPKAAEAKPDGETLTSPMVGTVYLSSQPGAPPFVKVGDSVKVGDTLLIIEAMKVMNPIKATAAGVVKQIMAKDTKPVEFGEALMIIG